MKTDQYMEKIYELLEQFEWNDLSEQDKAHILSIMSEIEYTEMRNALTDTHRYFTHAVEPDFNEKLHESIIIKSMNKNIFLAFLKQPIQLYKVVASIAVIFTIYSAVHYINPQENNKLLASRDTIMIHKTDTIYSRLTDTVTIIKEKIIQMPQLTKLIAPIRQRSASKFKFDCTRDICPNDIDIIKELACNNKASNDTLLNDFIVSVK